MLQINIIYDEKKMAIHGKSLMFQILLENN